MNRVFTKSNKIVLDDKWYITSDGDSGIVLTFHETREGKRNGVLEKYEFTEPYYYPKIVQALSGYVNKSQAKCDSLEEVLEVTRRILSLLEKLDKEFRQFN